MPYPTKGKNHSTLIPLKFDQRRNDKNNYRQRKETSVRIPKVRKQGFARAKLSLIHRKHKHKEGINAYNQQAKA